MRMCYTNLHFTYFLYTSLRQCWT